MRFSKRQRKMKRTFIYKRILKLTMFKGEKNKENFMVNINITLYYTEKIKVLLLLCTYADLYL